MSPAHATGTVNLVVTTPGGKTATVAADQFTFGTPPTIMSISPPAGPPSGRTVVTIVGTGFTGTVHVAFGAVAATSVTRLSNTQLHAVSPPQAAATVGVSVTTAAGTSPTTGADAFTYAPVPTVTGVSPTTGSTKGGTSVTITGTGFTGATKVAFGTTSAAHFVVVSSTKITTTSPAHAKGSLANIVPTAPGGKSAAVAASKFTYSAKVKVVPGNARVNGPTTTRPIATYTYNGDGLRMGQATPSGTVSFVWDTTPTVPELLTDGSFSYIYGPGGMPLEQIDGSSNADYFFHDAKDRRKRPSRQLGRWARRLRSGLTELRREAPGH